MLNIYQLQTRRSYVLFSGCASFFISAWAIYLLMEVESWKPLLWLCFCWLLLLCLSIFGLYFEVLLWKLDAWIVVLGKTLESPFDSRECKPVHPKGKQPWIFIGRTDAEAEGTILCPPDGKSQLNGRAGGEGDNRGWDGWMTSPTQWTWTWANSGRYQRTRKPWCAVVHKVTKSQTLLSNCTTKVGAYVFKIIISFSSIDRLSLVHYVVFFFVPWQSLFYLLSNSNGSEPRDRLVVRGGSTGDLEQIIISL